MRSRRRAHVGLKARRAATWHQLVSVSWYASKRSSCSFVPSTPPEKVLEPPPRPRLMDFESVGNRSLRHQAKKYFKGLIADCRGLCPTNKLSKMGPNLQIATSDLKEGPDKHFQRFTPTVADKERIRKGLNGMFKHCGYERQLMRPVALCSGHIMARVATMMGAQVDSPSLPAILSEAELRYAVADPIMDMLSNCWGHQVNKVYWNLCKSYCTLAPTGEA